MTKNKVAPEETPAAPAMTPDMLLEIKKEDMQQAVVERFRGNSEPSARRTATRSKRAPYWRPVAEGC
jgi:hypothetical protein